jgi:hypothetical protein
MRQFTWSMVALACIAALSAGCRSASCPSYCEQAQALGCGSSACIGQCEAGRINSGRAGCGDAYQRALNCAEENPCTSAEACSAQRAEFDTCAIMFCDTHPGHTLCGTP